MFLSIKIRKNIIKEIQRNKPVFISILYILSICLLAIFAQSLAPFSFETQNANHVLEGPSWQYLMGTDNLGRDLFSRLIYGAQVSMSVGIFATLISFVIGLIYGSISGWFGGWIDHILMRFIDILYSIPSLVLLILIIVFFNSQEFIVESKSRAFLATFIALSIFGWVNIARLVRAQVMQTKNQLYIESARALGLSSPRIIYKHILPNIMGPIIVSLTFQIPSNIMFESFLSFIGLGIQAPYSSWGSLISDGWRSLQSYPHIILGPSAALFLCIFSFNLLGDYLRDKLDPKIKN